MIPSKYIKSNCNVLTYSSRGSPDAEVDDGNNDGQLKKIKIKNIIKTK